MRLLLLILLTLVLVLGAAALWLVRSTPDDAPPLRFPLDADQRQLLASAPADAEVVALLPAVAVVHGRLLANAVTRQPVLEWTSRTEVPPRWVVGAADAAIWRAGETTGFAVRLDPVRAILARGWFAVAARQPVTWAGSTLLVNAPSAGGFDAAAVETLTRGLPASDALVIHTANDEQAFPPGARPAVSGVTIAANELSITTRTPLDDAPAGPPVRPSFPQGAMFAGWFASAPRLLADLERLWGGDVSALAADGGIVALYELDSGTLLPRPRGAIAVPAAPATRAAADDLRGVIGLIGEVREHEGELIVSFDRRSAAEYAADPRVPSSWMVTDWALRIDARRFMPALGALDKPAIRFVAPRVYRNARNLRRWIGALGEADLIEAAHASGAEAAELRIRVTSK
jgi:hypothetical protein